MFQKMTQMIIPNGILMIPNGHEWHYFAVKRLSALLKGITSKHHGEFYSLSCLHFFATENKPESHKKLSENNGFCSIIITAEDTKIFEFIQYQKSVKAPFNIYADLESIKEKIDRRKNNLKNLATAKVREHIRSCLQDLHLET